MSKRPKLKTQVRSITPQIARVLLARGGKNRHIIPSRVDLYARSIENDEWVVGEPILIDTEGCVIDGQHRLAAVVKAGKAVQFVVIEGYDADETFGKIGVGRSRSFADWASIEGIQTPSVYSAAARMLHTFSKVGTPQGRHIGTTMANGKQVPIYATQAELLVFAQKYHRELTRSMAAVPAAISKVASRPRMVFLHVVFARKDEDAADIFMEDLCYGTRLSALDPVYKLREKLTQGRFQTGAKQMSSVEVFGLCVKAWNAVRSNRTVRALNWKTGDGFPEIQ